MLLYDYFKMFINEKNKINHTNEANYTVRESVSNLDLFIKFSKTIPMHEQPNPQFQLMG